MNVTRAVVREVLGDEAVVEVEATGCGRCNEPGGCGGAGKADLFCHGRKYRVLNPLGAAPGEAVDVAIAAGAITRSATRAYVVPLLSLLIGAGLGRLAVDTMFGEFATIAGALLGLLAGWRWLHVARTGAGPEARPTIVGRV